jgi:low affinity Fe/Cu permease
MNTKNHHSDEHSHPSEGVSKKLDCNNDLIGPDADVKISKISRFYNKLSSVITKSTGSPMALIIAMSIIIIWGVTGPIFHYSDTWQLVINTGTTIITFLMVFIIQQSQNKDTVAVHLKLNELIAVNEHASNRLVDIEDLSDKELEVLKKFYIKISELAENDQELFTTHSLDEAASNSTKKIKAKMGRRGEETGVNDK